MNDGGNTATMIRWMHEIHNGCCADVVTERGLVWMRRGHFFGVRGKCERGADVAWRSGLLERVINVRCTSLQFILIILLAISLES